MTHESNIAPTETSGYFRQWDVTCRGAREDQKKRAGHYNGPQIARCRTGVSGGAYMQCSAFAVEARHLGLPNRAAPCLRCLHQRIRGGRGPCVRWARIFLVGSGGACSCRRACVPRAPFGPVAPAGVDAAAPIADPPTPPRRRRAHQRRLLPVRRASDPSSPPCGLRMRVH